MLLTLPSLDVVPVCGQYARQSAIEVMSENLSEDEFIILGCKERRNLAHDLRPLRLWHLGHGEWPIGDVRRDHLTTERLFHETLHGFGVIDVHGHRFALRLCQRTSDLDVATDLFGVGQQSVWPALPLNPKRLANLARLLVRIHQVDGYMPEQAVQLIVLGAQVLEA